ncbi:MAG: hypothetical protein H7070_04550 [Saprospiraceae bacterium]|nr:hypothetical protein [Pyrinomonadaceae bacterium]
MTLIAGIISRDPNSPVSVSSAESLKDLISRNLSDEPIVFQDKHSYMLKVDIGAYGETAHTVDEDGTLTLLAGEPLLSDEGGRKSRQADVDSIHNGFIRRDREVLTKAQGVFCAAHYHSSTGTLYLVADKLGLRPIYYWVDDEYVVFASALRILEEFAEIPKKMDLRAVTEIVGLSYPLSDRTPYANIFRIKAAEIVEISGSAISRNKYWSWDDIKPSTESEEDLLKELYDRFDNAVSVRNGSDTATVVYLSGGLDSRCVAAALHSNGVRMHSFNFARPNSQDQSFGLEYARQINSIHQEIPKDPGNHVPDYSSIMAQAWGESSFRDSLPVERPAIVWSGEGGSVALGHVHTTVRIVDLMRAGRTEEAIEAFIEQEFVYLPSKLFRPKIYARLSGIINRGIREELVEINATDPARGFFLFLLLNDQHRKLANHFENIDLHRLEFQLPFFDSSFLELIASIPLDYCLKHKLYTKWLDHFHPSVTAVPWQSYPGHEPCPIPPPPGLTYQWAEDFQKKERVSQKKHLAREAWRMVTSTDFPGNILSKRNLRLAFCAHATGLRDYGYIIDGARIYYRYSKKCGGRFDIQPD